MQKNTGIKRVMMASYYSYKGLAFAFTKEAAFRQEAFLAVLMFPVIFFIDATAVERVLLVGSMLLVLIVELVNTSIEAAVDRVSLERHELAGLAKDLGSAAVFIALLLCAFTWAMLLVPKFIG